MHFAFTPEQAMIAETARGFFAEAATSERTRAAMAGDGIDRALWTAFAQEMGLAGVALPEAYGGSGLGMAEAAIVAEAAGAQVAALPFLASSLLAGSAIAAGGSEAQRERYLPGIASGARIASFVEIGPSGMGLAPHGAVADLFVVAIGGAVALVEAADVTVEALPSMDATRPLARVRLGNAAVEPLDPVKALTAAHARGAVALAADSLGGAQALLARTVAYAQERIQFGRSIGSF